MIEPGLFEKVVLVTGGSAGIGEAIARAFDAVGARVAVHYLGHESDPPPATAWEHITPPTSEALRVANSLRDAIAAEQDLSQADAAPRLFDAVESSLGPVDVLVNNAAHCESPDTFAELSHEGLARHYLINAVAPARLIAELARRRSGVGACAINISTDAARAFAGQIGYGSSKAALEAVTRAAALELAPLDIRVNAVAPGPIQTGWMSDEVVAHATSVVPLGRVGRPSDIGHACVFLASEQASFITGQVIQVAGGHAL